MDNFYNVDSDSLLSKARNRKKRIQQAQRNHVCICGKGYLSSSALYTHIKNKHEPKKQDSQQLISEDYWLNKPQQQELFLFLDRLIKQFQHHLHNTNDHSEQNHFYAKQIKLYWKEHTKEQLMYKHPIYQATIDKAFGLFLTYAEKQMSKYSYSFIQKLIVDMHQGLNQLQSDPQYCKNTDASRLPLCMNDLFVFRLEGEYCLQQYENKRTLICIVIYHFSQWLLQQKLTNLILRLNLR